MVGHGGSSAPVWDNIYTPLKFHSRVVILYNMSTPGWIHYVIWTPPGEHFLSLSYRNRAGMICVPLNSQPWGEYSVLFRDHQAKGVNIQYFSILIPWKGVNIWQYNIITPWKGYIFDGIIFSPPEEEWIFDAVIFLRRWKFNVIIYLPLWRGVKISHCNIITRGAEISWPEWTFYI